METNGESRLMEPIYRMIKVIQQTDAEDAKIAAALTVQYIGDHFKENLRREDVQSTLRAVLVYFKDGRYYNDYLANELQVMTAQWMTILAADLDITIGEIGQSADRLADWLHGKDALALTAEEMREYFLSSCAFSAELAERVRQNTAYYYDEFKNVLGK